MQFKSFEDLRAQIGREIAVSDWLLITQERVNRFAEITNDPDWMHTDVERARQGPVGETIVQGFLTLSLLLHFTHQAAYLPKDVQYAFNYGLDRVRWITPIRVGKRIRNHMSLHDITSKGEDRYLLSISNTVEIEGESRPAMVAQWLGLLQAAAGGSRTTGWP
jgi:acyl dehydratase